MLFEPLFQAAVNQRIRTKMDFIRRQGNAAAHDSRPIKAEAAVGTVRELFHVMFWIARTYARDRAYVPHASLTFNDGAIPRPLTAEQRQTSMEALRREQAENARRDAELERARADNAALQAQLDQLRAQIAQVQPANESLPDDHDYDEQETRGLYIDLLLREAGWPLDETRDREYEVTACRRRPAMDSSTTCCGAMTATRSGWSRPSAPGAIRASASSRPSSTPTVWKSSTASGPSSSTPTATSTGYGTTTRYPPRAVQGFYTKDELELLIQRRTHAAPLATAEINYGDRRALLPAARHPAHRRGVRADHAAQGAAGDGDRRRQDPHGDRACRPADAGRTGSSACCSWPTAWRWSTRRSTRSRRICPTSRTVNLVTEQDHATGGSTSRLIRR